MKAGAINVGMKENVCDDHIDKNEIHELHTHYYYFHSSLAHKFIRLQYLYIQINLNEINDCGCFVDLQG